MAKAGVKSKTIVHEIVMMLFFFPSFVVTRTTGPGSINVKAVLIFNLFMQVPPYYAVRKHGNTVVRSAPFVGKALALAQNGT